MAAEDLAEVLELERALFPGDAWSEGMFRDELSQGGRHYVVAEVPGHPGLAGFAGLRAIPPEGDVQTMAVAERWWGNGFGTALLAELIAEAERRGVGEMFLEVRSDNPRAQELYRRFGFVEIGLRRGYYRSADAITMHRSRQRVLDGNGPATGPEQGEAARGEEKNRG